ncbi:DUF3141 domain-containing protein [uncultured Paracoccus sp.]|uniref:DUF3141 domain-containing protein n=1 Tax=uncultured Paracoccus sp. TaxID=189685 RepID=UPI0026098E5D|nr:DUF3141 domain-containing protein [uncultured Paracoccus sp.]
MNTQTQLDKLAAANIDPEIKSGRDHQALPGPVAYGRDLWERSVLFMDTLRERADNIVAHDRAGMPPLLDFRYETLLDARQFAKPVNYALLRITEVDGHCWDDCIDAAKPPVMIVDPRAGHGPGIGGFKRDSEVGMAMVEGHPVYFVIFYPEPVKGQTLDDVLSALRRFVEEVSRRHDGAAPVLYGNCQAGWAVTLLAAHCEGLAGPVVLNGSPLSYWAGEEGVNPMRVTGGLLGGSWLAHLTADLGDGRFDGAWLAQNFENLKPEKAIWEKYANLLMNIDTERERFLEFERWWNGFYTLSREEILEITQDLFIGNLLENGEMRIGDHCVADLRKIRNPIVVFASYGDNITPPAQALGWIPAVYKDTADLKSAGQRIIYMTNAHVGHLGIFVSASVARLEHRAILESLERIGKLEPGLYEMKVANPSGGDPDCHASNYTVRFEPRDVADLRHDVPIEAFEQVARLSEANEAFYSAFVSPWVRVMASPASAEMLKWMHPMRTSRLVFSESFNPWMRLVRQTAETIARTREPLARGDPLLAHERAMIAAVGDAIERARIARDARLEGTFRTLFGDGGGAHGDDTDGENNARLPV